MHNADCEAFEVDPLALREKRLLFAILERAIVDTVHNDQVIKRQALTWVRSRVNISTPTKFDFSWICLELNLCPYTLQRTILHGALSPILSHGTKTKKQRHSKINSNGTERIIEFIYSNNDVEPGKFPTRTRQHV